MTFRNEAWLVATLSLLSATAQAELAPGDVFVIETPGGGGYGKA